MKSRDHNYLPSDQQLKISFAGWLEPMAQRVKDDPKTVVIPMIDSISDRTLEFYGHPGGISISVGGFTWSVSLSSRYFKVELSILALREEFQRGPCRTEVMN